MVSADGATMGTDDAVSPGVPCYAVAAVDDGSEQRGTESSAVFDDTPEFCSTQSAEPERCDTTSATVTSVATVTGTTVPVTAIADSAAAVFEHAVAEPAESFDGTVVSAANGKPAKCGSTGDEQCRGERR